PSGRPSRLLPGEPSGRHRSFRSISSTRNLALLIASLAAATARGERPPSQSLRLRAANMAAAIPIACCFACFCISCMEILRGRTGSVAGDRELDSSTLRLWLLSWILGRAVVTIGEPGSCAQDGAELTVATFPSRPESYRMVHPEGSDCV